MPAFALVDCNNFFASCEQLFDPRLRGKPVVVLSNNDGCIVARSAEAKALGVPMGQPWYQVRAAAQRHGIVPRSSNYALYADMSRRVVEVLTAFAPEIEVYSIDESFLALDTVAPDARLAHAAALRERVRHWLGLAVCVGIAPSKTLAKLANHCAKQGLASRDGVCDFSALPPAALDALLARLPVGEVWGVGRRLAPRLEAEGLANVRALRDADPARLARRHSIVLERIVHELRGVSCLDLEDVAGARQQILRSRSFGSRIYAVAELREAVSHHVAHAAEALRAQGSLAGALAVSLRTGWHAAENERYIAHLGRPLAPATDDTRILTTAALRLVDTLYRPGYAYAKAGVLLSELCPRRPRQPDLFAAPDSSPASARLMQTLDGINARWGRDTLRLAAEGTTQAWQMKRAHLSPRYTTDWKGLPAVRAG